MKRSRSPPREVSTAVAGPGSGSGAPVDFATSYVRGAQFPLYIAGARILANFPVGPTGGTAWNLTLMSYDGHLDMGLNCDAGAVADPELLRDAIVTEFAALIAAGTQEGTRRPKARR